MAIIIPLIEKKWDPFIQKVEDVKIEQWCFTSMASSMGTSASKIKVDN